MQAREAIEQISNTTFKPGWSFTATPGYGDNEVYVSLTIRTVDTSYTMANGTFPVSITTGDSRVFNVGHMDRDKLCYHLLQFAAEADSHENREFLKIRQADGSWYAPLHPHTHEGQMSWHQQRWEAGS